MVSERGGRQWMVGNNTKSRSPVMTAQKLGGKESHVLSKSRGNHSSMLIVCQETMEKFQAKSCVLLGHPPLEGKNCPVTITDQIQSWSKCPAMKSSWFFLPPIFSVSCIFQNLSERSACITRVNEAGPWVKTRSKRLLLGCVNPAFRRIWSTACEIERTNFGTSLNLKTWTKHHPLPQVVLPVTQFLILRFSNF